MGEAQGEEGKIAVAITECPTPLTMVRGIFTHAYHVAETRARNRIRFEIHCAMWAKVYHRHFHNCFQTRTSVCICFGDGSWSWIMPALVAAIAET